MGATEQLKSLTNSVGVKKTPSKSRPILRTDDKLPLVDNIYLFGTVGNVIKQLHAMAGKQHMTQCVKK